MAVRLVSFPFVFALFAGTPCFADPADPDGRPYQAADTYHGASKTDQVEGVAAPEITNPALTSKPGKKRKPGKEIGIQGGNRNVESQGQKKRKRQD